MAKRKHYLKKPELDDWWDKWRRRDFSWNGLKSHDWKGWVFVSDLSAYKKFIKDNGLPLGSRTERSRCIPV